MSELPRLLLLLAIAGVAMTFLGSAALWLFDEERRIRRARTRVLKAPPDSLLLARGRGRGAGFSFASGLAAVAWDNGGWCLIYRIDELIGAELLVDGQVVARASRGEPRRALDQIAADANQVTLRLIFDDARYPDFGLDLYVIGDELRRQPMTATVAIQEANQWLARAEAILRRPAAPRGRPPVFNDDPEPAPVRPLPVTVAPPPPQPAPAPPPPVAPLPPPPSPPADPAPAAEVAPMVEEPPPWDDAILPPPPRSRKRRAAADEDQDDLPF